MKQSISLSKDFEDELKDLFSPPRVPLTFAIPGILNVMFPPLTRQILEKEISEFQRKHKRTPPMDPDTLVRIISHLNDNTDIADSLYTLSNWVQSMSIGYAMSIYFLLNGASINLCRLCPNEIRELNPINIVKEIVRNNCPSVERTKTTDKSTREAEAE